MSASSIQNPPFFMFLLHLPFDILREILRHLPRPAIAQLCLTCKDASTQCLPALYHHITLGYKAHVRQLVHGIRHRPELRHTLEQYTRKITLRPRQSGSHWLIADFFSLFPVLSSVTVVVLSHFAHLSVNRIRQLALTLPRVSHLSIEYCNLVVNKEEAREADWGVMETTFPSDTSERYELATCEGVFREAAQLSLVWTDFSPTALQEVFRAVPKVLRIDLGANHNKIQHANDESVAMLPTLCPQLQHISVSLQQVKESTLCSMISHYAQQLKTLSVRCDSPETLQTVATHATQLKSLTVRAANTPWAAAPFSPATKQGQEHSVSDIVTGILEHCQGLIQLEMESWMMQDVPFLVWRALETVAERRDPQQKHNVFLAMQPQKMPAKHKGRMLCEVYEDMPATPRVSVEDMNKEQGSLRKTLRLQREELQEIRLLI
ncbi:hypothetical protein BDF14DRAFT_1763496 [Spinellus fusiger]|nr:hypothetical protein BDF14DRAFT_1763496 [Spinellus fusiger]